MDQHQAELVRRLAIIAPTRAERLTALNEYECYLRDAIQEQAEAAARHLQLDVQHSLDRRIDTLQETVNELKMRNERQQERLTYCIKAISHNRTAEEVATALVTGVDGDTSDVIHLIKTFREITGWGLKDSKDQIDQAYKTADALRAAAPSLGILA
jgi:ribosomal protein L7/L12